MISDIDYLDMSVLKDCVKSMTRQVYVDAGTAAPADATKNPAEIRASGRHDC